MIYIPDKILPIKVVNILKEIEMDEYFRTVKESPQEVAGRTVGDRYNAPDTNQYEREQFLKSGAKKIGEFQFYKYQYDIYEKKEGEYVYFGLLDDKYIILAYDVRPITIKNLKGIESLNPIQSQIGDRSAWLHIANKFVFDFLLKHYDFIISDKVQTTSGKMFWQRMLSESIGYLYCYAFDPNTNTLVVLSDLNNFDTYYNKKYKEFRFIVSNGEIV
jgi:hypothetical protein